MRGSLDERSSSTDFKEAYVWGRFKSNLEKGEYTQAMPESTSGLRSKIEDFDDKCFEASLRVLDMLSQALNVRQAEHSS